MTRGMRRRPGTSKYQACTRKEGQWENKRDAQNAAIRANESGRFLSEKFAYLCKYCKGYHIGSPVGRR